MTAAPTTSAAPTCPPCNQNCEQGRACPARENLVTLTAEQVAAVDDMAQFADALVPGTRST